MHCVAELAKKTDTSVNNNSKIEDEISETAFAFPYSVLKISREIKYGQICNRRMVSFWITLGYQTPVADQ